MLPKLYGEFASWWPLLSAPEDYDEEADFYAKQLTDAGDAPGRTLLELGCGGGNNASFLKRRFDMTLVDVSPGMLAHSRALNPECVHVEGDMRTVRLGKTFDRVFVHDAIMYMTSEEDLRRAIETASLHCRPGGGALFAPDHLKETFAPSTSCGGEDGGAGGSAGPSARYLEWGWDPDPTDNLVTTDYVYVFREANGVVHVEHDRHIEGLFPRDTWLSLLRAAGFEPRVVPFDHSELNPDEYELFVCKKVG